MAQSLEAPELSPSPSATPAKPWSFLSSSKYQFSLHTATDENKQSSLESTLEADYSASPRLRVQGVVGITQALQPALDFRVFNPQFRGYWLLNPTENKLKFYVGPTMTLPFGSDAKDESLIVGAGLGGRAVLKLNDASGVGFKAYYDLTVNKNFHQFDTSITGDVNNQYALNHTIYLEYYFHPQWNLNATTSFSSLWNYLGLISNTYTLEQELDFQATDLVMLFFSHTRGGDFLGPDGQSYSFGIFDPDASRFALGMYLSF